MTKEPDTASTQVWQAERMAGSMLALITLIRIRMQSIDVPRWRESKLPNGCAFAIRYTSR